MYRQLLSGMAGLWAVEVADAHPGVEINGKDLSPIQPDFVPPNCHFIVDNFEYEWAFDKKFVSRKPQVTRNTTSFSVPGPNIACTGLYTLPHASGWCTRLVEALRTMLGES